MSFLDNLENNLKALENLEAGGIDDRKRREAAREREIAAAPWAERLKNSAYVGKLMRDLTKAGFARRMKVHFVWIGRSLRLEAMGERVELEPTPGGVEAVFADRRLSDRSGWGARCANRNLDGDSGPEARGAGSGGRV